MLSRDGITGERGAGLSFGRLFLPLVMLVLAGCGALTLSPLTSEDRSVSPVVDAGKSVILKESMVWYDQEVATRGIRFPEGQYLLEAEDAEYYYFRSPSPLEYRIFQNGSLTDGRFMPGGLFLSKALINMVPAGAYLSVEDPKQKTLTWKLGSNFLRKEGSLWTKNF